MNVVVLGASGMLGSMVLDWLSRDASLKMAATVRSRELLGRLSAAFPAGIEWRLLDAERCSEDDVAGVLADAQWAINAIGVIKPYIRDENAAEVERAILVNARFPHVLAKAAAQRQCRVLQIATDCVYSGAKGAYSEKEGHDALDVYGKTKSLGEVHSPAVGHLRCSIIGPEPRGHVSLMDWFLGQPRGGSVGGYTNHQWNGVTTLHFARLCHGVIRQGLDLPHVQHVVPGGARACGTGGMLTVAEERLAELAQSHGKDVSIHLFGQEVQPETYAISKADLLACLAREYQRLDVTITPTEAKTVIDRTLATADEALNRRLWAAAGYAQPPAVPQMVAEMARFDRKLKGGEL